MTKKCKRCGELEKQIADFMDPTLESMRLEDGKFDMQLGGEAVQRVALMMTEWFRESGAKNYVEMTLHAKTEPFESYQFYVQKQGDGAKTPHQLRVEVETQRDQLAKALEAALLIAKQEWDFPGAHPHRAATVRQMEGALALVGRPLERGE